MMLRLILGLCRIARMLKKLASSTLTLERIALIVYILSARTFLTIRLWWKLTKTKVIFYQLTVFRGESLVLMIELPFRQGYSRWVL